MPGNRALFDRAMEANRDAVQRREWTQALREALRAAQEFPSDLDARNAVAVGLYHTGKYAQAVQLLLELRKRQGDAPWALLYLARAYEGNNQVPEAISTLLTWGEQALAQRRSSDALSAWENAVRLAPTREDLRIRLAELLLDQGDKHRAAAQCVEIARQRQSTGDIPGAIEAMDEALSLDPGNRPAQVLRSQLTEQTASPQSSTGDAAPSSANPKATSAPATAPKPQTGSPALPGTGSLAKGSHSLRGGTGALGTGQLRDRRADIDNLVARATQLQAVGDTTGALNSYEYAIKLGARRNDVDYSLGLLLQERGDHERAVALLRNVADSEDYALSALFALAQSLRALGQIREAAENYEATIQLVDLETITRAEADDLVAMYEAAAECYSELGELARAASLLGTVASFFASKRWGKELADQFKARAKDLTGRAMFAKLRKIGTDSLPSQTDGESMPRPATQIWGAMPEVSAFLQTDTADQTAPSDQAPTTDSWSAGDLSEVSPRIWAPVTAIPIDDLPEMIGRLITTSARYIEQGLIYAAIDACHEVIRIDPHFLPIHLRLGEIYEREGRSEEALDKYRTLVDTWIARDKEIETIPVYYRLVEVSPDIIGTRTQLVELLRKAGRNEDAVEQGLSVADTLFKMGQSNRALEEYRRLQQWAPKNPALHKAYGQALLKLERWEAALHEFRHAVILDRNDAVALALLNISLAMLAQQERPMWDSLHSLLEQVRLDKQLLSPVLVEYRAALLIVDTPILYYIVGLLQQASGEHDSAVLSFEQALALLESDSHPILNPMLVHQALSASYLAAGQAQDALRELHRVQQLFVQQPLHVQSLHDFARPLTEAELQRRLATAWVANGDWTHAIRELERSLQFDPLDLEAHMQLAKVYTGLGKHAQALAQYEKLATTYEERQQLEQATGVLEQALITAPSNIPLRSRLSQLLIRRGLLDEGIIQLSEVATLHRHAGQIKEAVLAMQQVADVYWMLGQPDKTFRVYDQILIIVPNDIEVRQQLVNLLIMVGRTEGAIREQRRIAQIAQQQNSYDEAIASLHQIIALDPSDAITYEHLGDLLMRVQEYEQAVRLYKRLLRLRPSDEHVEALIAAAERMLMLQKAQPQTNRFAPVGGAVASA